MRFRSSTAWQLPLSNRHMQRPSSGTKVLRGYWIGVPAALPEALYATFRSEREDWVEEMVQAGLGFAFMPAYSIRPRDLHQRPLVDPAVQRDVLAVDVRGRARSPAARLFLAEIKGFAWPAPGAPSPGGTATGPASSPAPAG